VGGLMVMERDPGSEVTSMAREVLNTIYNKIGVHSVSALSVTGGQHSLSLPSYLASTQQTK
jgi:hypothetical protein